MERIRKAIIISSVVILGGCHWPPIIKNPEPYTLPMSTISMEPCGPSISLSSLTFEDVLKNKIDNDALYKECSAKNDTLRTIIESLDDEQIIRVITPGSKTSSPKVETTR